MIITTDTRGSIYARLLYTMNRLNCQRHQPQRTCTLSPRHKQRKEIAVISISTPKVKDKKLLIGNCCSQAAVLRRIDNQVIVRSSFSTAHGIYQHFSTERLWCHCSFSNWSIGRLKYETNEKHQHLLWFQVWTIQCTASLSSKNSSRSIRCKFSAYNKMWQCHWTNMWTCLGTLTWIAIELKLPCVAKIGHHGTVRWMPMVKLSCKCHIRDKRLRLFSRSVSRVY